MLYLAWHSPHSDHVATYAAFAFPIGILVAGWFTWAWPKDKASGTANAADGADLERATDELAVVVQKEWERAAGERGLTGVDSLQVSWGRAQPRRLS